MFARLVMNVLVCGSLATIVSSSALAAQTKGDAAAMLKVKQKQMAKDKKINSKRKPIAGGVVQPSDGIRR